MKAMKLAAGIAVASVALTAPAFAAQTEQGQGQAVITVLPKNNDLKALNIQSQSVQLKVDGKGSGVTSWTSAKGPNSPLELVILIDGSARTSLGTQLSDIESFVKEMPKDTRMAIAYMENGRAAFAGPLSSEPPQVLNGLHLPGGVPGQSSSPYFCLSDLAKNWPSRDMTARARSCDDHRRRGLLQPALDPDDPLRSGRDSKTRFAPGWWSTRSTGRTGTHGSVGL